MAKHKDYEFTTPNGKKITLKASNDKDAERKYQVMLLEYRWLSES